MATYRLSLLSCWAGEGGGGVLDWEEGFEKDGGVRRAGEADDVGPNHCNDERHAKRVALCQGGETACKATDLLAVRGRVAPCEALTTWTVGSPESNIKDGRWLIRGLMMMLEEVLCTLP